MGGRCEMELVDAEEDIGITVFLSRLQTEGCYQLPAKVKPAATNQKASPSCFTSRGAPAPASWSLFGPSGQNEWAGFQVGR